MRASVAYQFTEYPGGFFFFEVFLFFSPKIWLSAQLLINESDIFNHWNNNAYKQISSLHPADDLMNMKSRGLNKLL